MMGPARTHKPPLTPESWVDSAPGPQLHRERSGGGKSPLEPRAMATAWPPLSGILQWLESSELNTSGQWPWEGLAIPLAVQGHHRACLAWCGLCWLCACPARGLPTQGLLRATPRPLQMDWRSQSARPPGAKPPRCAQIPPPAGQPLAFSSPGPHSLSPRQTLG